ncbi:MAG: hypothetical protein AAF962_07915 [Actinomycetota bacterium]
MRLPLLAVALAALFVLSACSSDDDGVTDGGTNGIRVDGDLDSVHSLEEPTEEMRELAEQQCLDDPELEVGEITALDPEDLDTVLASVTVDCEEVRAAG